LFHKGAIKSGGKGRFLSSGREKQEISEALQAGGSTFAPFLRAGFQIGVDFMINRSILAFCRTHLRMGGACNKFLVFRPCRKSVRQWPVVKFMRPRYKQDTPMR
jgi:hypothetical protein